MNRILVVPDTLFTEIGPSFLDRGSFRVRAAQNGVEALLIAKVWRPDLVIFGSHLPDMRMLEFAQRMRVADPQTRLFLLSDTMETEGMTGMAEAKATDAHLVMPVDAAQLLVTMAALLDVRLRAAPRVTVRLLARLENVGLPEPEPGRPGATANVLILNERGALIEAPSELRVGALGTIQFFLPGAPERLRVPFLVQALVDEVLLHYGGAFVGIAEADVERVRAFVEARLSRREGEEGNDEDAWD